MSDISSLPTQANLRADEAYLARCATFYGEETRPQSNGEGKVVPEWAIDAETGRYLYDLVRRVKPRLSIEVGLCQGASALHFSSAYAANGAGLHLALDPFQDVWFLDQGVTTISRYGLAPWFKLLRTRSDRALPLLDAAGLSAEIIFIDGDHRFNAVFTDYVFADKLLADRGYLIFDEGGYECPTKRVDAFISANMPNYARIDSPLRLYVFQKIGADEREFGDWHDF